MNDEQWQTLAGKHNPNLVQHVRELVQKGQTKEFNPLAIAAKAGVGGEHATALLDDLGELDLLKKETFYKCPRCPGRLNEEAAKGETCHHCNENFAELGEQPEPVTVYVSNTELARNVSWLVAIHGMNTQGDWQQQFSWGIANTYRYAIPTAIYKYGKIIASPFLHLRQRHYVNLFATQLGSLPRELETASQKKTPPDVIAHSFGTWLLGHVLTDERYADVSVGRVILTGCILRPDFDWQKLVDDRRVEAVLNHYGTKDSWARIAHFFIPYSGSSGLRGFSRAGPLNVPAENYSHSQFFEGDNIRICLSQDGLWHRFLTAPLDQLPAVIEHDNELTGWSETHWLLRGFTRITLLVFVATIAMSLATILVLGILKALELVGLI